MRVQSRSVGRRREELGFRQGSYDVGGEVVLQLEGVPQVGLVAPGQLFAVSVDETPGDVLHCAGVRSRPSTAIGLRARRYGSLYSPVRRSLATESSGTRTTMLS